jgi:hypothetical protein
MDELKDPTEGHADLSDKQFKAVAIPGLPRHVAFSIFRRLEEKKFAVSLKHLGGFYFIEVPVTLIGDPCYGQNAEIQTIALNAGVRCVQTGPTLRIIG